MYVHKPSSHSVGCLLTSLMVSLEAQMFVILMKPSLFFSYCLCFLVSCLRIYCQIQGHKNLPLYFLPRLSECQRLHQVHLGLVFVYGPRLEDNLICLHADIQLSQHHFFVEEYFFSIEHILLYGILRKIYINKKIHVCPKLALCYLGCRHVADTAFLAAGLGPSVPEPLGMFLGLALRLTCTRRLQGQRPRCSIPSAAQPPQTLWLKTKVIPSQSQEARNPKSRRQQGQAPSRGAEGGPFPASSSWWWL